MILFLFWNIYYTIKLNKIIYKFISVVDKILAITQTEDYLENQEKQNAVKEYEKQIDIKVYKLYDLTYDEILSIDKEFELTEEDYNNFQLWKGESMENFRNILFKKLNDIKQTYSKLKDCNGSFEILTDDNCRFSINPINKNDYEELKLDNILTCFDTQKSTDLKNYSYFETTCRYINNQIIVEYRNIPFGAINVKKK